MQKTDIKKIAISKLKDAEVLFKNKRYDGAVYTCGYAIELGLKYQTCKRLRWTQYPPGNKENYKSFKTHNLDTLLSFTGKENAIKNNHLNDWSTARDWDPEDRYNPVGKISQTDAKNMIQSIRTLLKLL